jgi:hypothetical protein
MTGGDLIISGMPPTYQVPAHGLDLISQYENYRHRVPIGQQKVGMLAPDVSFANADTDEKLVAFVGLFGPVVAKHLLDTRVTPNPRTGKRENPGWLTATQDLAELRKERAIFRAAFELAVELNSEKFDHQSIQPRMRVIAANIRDWPGHWDRESSLRGYKPKWQLTPESLQLIAETSERQPDAFFGSKLDGRVVICELLNTFPGFAFPNALQLHSSIKFGIRPLLYSLLRRRFAFPRGTDVCANTECRNYFNLERTGQKFCSAECSRQQRQREYWKQFGKERRRKRIKKK